MSPGALSQTAPRYQRTSSARQTTAGGPAWPAKARESAPRAATRGGNSASVVIAVSGAQALAHAVGDLREAAALAQVEGAVGRELAVDDVDDAAGARRHDDDLRRQEDRLGRSEEHTSELQSLMRRSYAVFCLKKNKTQNR